jgi:hypothetical protein
MHVQGGTYIYGYILKKKNVEVAKTEKGVYSDRFLKFEVET